MIAYILLLMVAANMDMRLWDYERRHDNIGKIVHWKLVKKSGYPVKDKWFEHQPENVWENAAHKISWGFIIQINHAI